MLEISLFWSRANSDTRSSIHAALKADEMLAQGNLDGKAVWLGVIKAIEELQVMEERPEGIRVH